MPSNHVLKFCKVEFFKPMGNLWLEPSIFSKTFFFHNSFIFSLDLVRLIDPPQPPQVQATTPNANTKATPTAIFSIIGKYLTKDIPTHTMPVSLP